MTDRSSYGEKAMKLPERTNEAAGDYATGCVEVAKEVGVSSINLWSKMQETEGWQKKFLKLVILPSLQLHFIWSLDFSYSHKRSTQLHVAKIIGHIYMVLFAPKETSIGLLIILNLWSILRFYHSLMWSCISVVLLEE